MSGRRTTVVGVVLGLTVVTGAAACDERDAGRLPAPLGASSTAQPDGSAALGGGVPDLEEDLPVTVGAASQVFGLGCRLTSPHQRCTPDGAKTYTLAQEPRQVTMTRARMRLQRDGGGWVVSLRFARPDRAVVQRTAAEAREVGGYAVVLDAGSGDVLQSVAPEQVERGGFTLRGLDKPVAWELVSAYVAAAVTGATQR